MKTSNNRLFTFNKQEALSVTKDHGKQIYYLTFYAMTNCFYAEVF
jgi:hypothetical protein